MSSHTPSIASALPSLDEAEGYDEEHRSNRDRDTDDGKRVDQRLVGGRLHQFWQANKEQIQGISPPDQGQVPEGGDHEDGHAEPTRRREIGGDFEGLAELLFRSKTWGQSVNRVRHDVDHGAGDAEQYNRLNEQICEPEKAAADDPANENGRA